MQLEVELSESFSSFWLSSLGWNTSSSEVLEKTLGITRGKINSPDFEE
jgi:hypothetical protein